MHERGFLVRLAHNSDDAGELLSSCQAMKDALDTFYVSCSRFFEPWFFDRSPGWYFTIGGKQHAPYPQGISHLTCDRGRYRSNDARST
jgi:hypothetical protein